MTVNNITNIDYCTLIQQKAVLVELERRAYQDKRNKLADYLEGVLQILDTIQDAMDVANPKLVGKCYDCTTCCYANIIEELFGASR